MSEDRTFEYLLNAMERAAQEENPAAYGYGGKRQAVFAYVRELERRANTPYVLGSASATSSKPAEDTALGSSAPPPCPTA